MFTHPAHHLLRTSFPLLLLAPAPSLVAQSSDWLTYNGSYEGSRFSELAQITAANAAELGEVCTFDTGEQMSSQSGPVVVDGVLYLTTDTSTYAIDAATCALKWRQSRSYSPLSTLKNNHGVAYMDGRLYRVAGNVHAYSLDAATGEVLWDVAFGDPTKGESAPMAPVAWDGLVFLGNAGGDVIGVTGRVYALDAASGREVWHFDVVPDSGAARQTWPSGPDAVPPTGGGMWSTFTLDPARGVLYVPAGNPAPDFILELRPGKNLYTNSVLALDARTGRLLDYIQTVEDDYHDWDVSAAPALITTESGTVMLALAGKDGLLHAITGAPDDFAVQYSVPTTTRSNIDAPLTHTQATRFCPGTQGGTEWNGPAYSPPLNLLFAGAVDWCANIQLVHPDSITLPLAQDFTGAVGGGFGNFDPKEQWQGWITAVDADSGSVRWKYRADTPILAGITATAGGIVVTGDMNGDLLVFDAATGELVHRAETGAAMGAGNVTYAVDDQQYIAAAGGSISPIWPLPEATSRVTVFGLR
ncbi:MAG: pyrroloquinoline quinone-dependent dehydrogenase [Longimicrobiales bacterium]